MITYDGDDIKISRIDVSKKRGGLSVLDLYYTIAEKNKTPINFIDRHELGLFKHDETLKIMKNVELKTKFIKSGIGLYIGIKK